MKHFSPRNTPRVIRPLLCLAALLLTGSALAAGPLYWDWPSSREFNELDLQGTALNARGEVVPGLVAVQVPVPGAEVAWCLVADLTGGYYLGTGHGGEIHWTDGSGEARQFAVVEGNEVFSLLARPGGELLAGCGPEGQVHTVFADGTSRLLGQIDGGYVWSMCTGATDEEVWLATGSPAALYRWRETDGLRQMATFPALNALDVAVDRDGTLLVATQGPGLVYRVEPDGKTAPHLVFQADQDEVRQFITGPDGALHFLALRMGGENGDPGLDNDGNGAFLEDMVALFSNKPPLPVDKAAIYRLEADDAVVPMWSGDADLMIVTWSPDHGWLGGGTMKDDQSRLLKLTPPYGSYPVAGWPGGDVLDILFAAGGAAAGDILVAQAHPGAISRLSGNRDAGRQAVSPPLDGHQQVRWGRLSWQGDTAGGQLKWSVRGGNSSTPDTTWTDWSRSWTDHNQPLSLPPSRYLQWRVVFDGQVADAAVSRLQTVSVSAWQDNQPPVIRQFNLEQVTAMNRGGLMNHSDNITQTFRSGLKAEFSRTSQADRRVGPSRAAETRPVRVFTWQGFDPNGDRLDYTLAYRSTGSEVWRNIVERTEEQIGSWDTAAVPDGTYEVRLTASDRADNPGPRALSTSQVSPRLMVDNTEPEISGFKARRTETGLAVRFKASDRATALAGATLTLPDGEVMRLDPVDLICDSRHEEFKVELPWPPPGGQAGTEPWQVRVDVRDMGGNLAVAEGDVR